ncbi:MAG: hypothetical protein WCK90_03585 [archaeon]
MTEQYEPSNFEIAGRLMKKYVTGIGYGLMMPWAIPSTIVAGNMNGLFNENSPGPSGMSIMTYLATLGAQIAGVTYYVKDGGLPKTLWLCLLASNVASGLVEIVSGNCRSVRKELINEKKRMTNDDLVRGRRE